MALAKAITLYTVWNAIGCHIKYVGQTKTETLIDSKVRFFYIKHTNNTTVARHFHSYKDKLDPNDYSYLGST